MPHKGYQENNSSAYYQPSCAQESSQQYMSCTTPLVSNNVYNNQGQSVYDMVYSHQNVHRSQLPFSNNCANIYSDHIDYWNNDTDRTLKFADKAEAVDIMSKDLSPASFCSNLDFLAPDIYKNMNKDSYNKMQESLSVCNANYNLLYNEFPSCSQFNCDDGTVDKSIMYCTIQKQNDINKNATTSTCIYNNENITKAYSQENNQCDYTIYHDKVQNIPIPKVTHIQPEEFYPQNQLLCSDILHFPTIQNINQHTEGSNDESDIIVEDSEEEITDYSEELEKRFDYPTYCIVCNIMYNASENQFFILTSKSPMTTSSRQPVIIKLTEIVGKVNNKYNYLCNHCLELINTIDHLQYKLNRFKCDLFNKFSVTNGTNTSKNKRLLEFKAPKKQDPCKHNFRCKLCKKVFSLKKYYNFHVSKHRDRTRYLCEICGKQFNKSTKFTFHLKSHMKLENFVNENLKIDAYLCRTCKKPFKTKSHLKDHERYCSGNMPYVCNYSQCGKKFPASTKLKYHIKLKHDKKFTSICSICNIGFVKMSDYKTHMMSHSTNKKFHCSKCGKSYKNLGNLNFHLKLHSEKLPFICNICNKGFMRKEYLEAHINKHNGIKNFTCQFCDKKFFSQKNLDAHLKYHDGSVKKKTCNVCGKLISIGLEDHIRTHSNLREFSCDICNMKFNTKSASAKHKKRKHDNKYANN